MTEKTIIKGFLFMLLVISFSCKTKTQMAGIDLNITFSEGGLSDNLLTDIEYVWKTDNEFKRIDQDMNVFVHVWHGNNLLIQDDHVPDISTSQWESNEKYSYKREIYIPSFIDKFNPYFKGHDYLTLSIGFFSPYDWTGESKKEVLREKLKVFPQPDEIPEIIYENGWYNLEIDYDTDLKQWRWTAKKARCIIDNPHRDAILIIKGSFQSNVFEKQQVIFRVNNLLLDEFFLEEISFEKSYEIKEEMLGEGDEFYLTIETDKTFIPAEVFPDSIDQRELGLTISFIYFR